MVPTKEVIDKFDKTTILMHFKSNIRLWYVSGVLPQRMIEDIDIIPYFTPCNGHRVSYVRNEFEEFSEVDGVLPMMGFCSKCKGQKGNPHPEPFRSI